MVEAQGKAQEEEGTTRRDEGMESEKGAAWKGGAERSENGGG